MVKSSLLPALAAFALLTGAATGAFAGGSDKKQSVDFHDIHKDGTVAIIGHFGIPIGQIVTVEGHLEKPSKVSDEMTLHFTKINGSAIRENRWGSLIQIKNVDSLPKDEPIVVEGYEFLSWRGAPEINWNVEVEFVITKVISPASLKLNKWTPW